MTGRQLGTDTRGTRCENPRSGGPNPRSDGGGAGGARVGPLPYPSHKELHPAARRPPPSGEGPPEKEGAGPGPCPGPSPRTRNRATQPGCPPRRAPQHDEHQMPTAGRHGPRRLRHQAPPPARKGARGREGRHDLRLYARAGRGPLTAANDRPGRAQRRPGGGEGGGRTGERGGGTRGWGTRGSSLEYSPTYQ